MGWMDRAEQQLEDELAQGYITQEEYRAGLRDIRDEYEQQRQDAAQEAYENY